MSDMYDMVPYEKSVTGDPVGKNRLGGFGGAVTSFDFML